MGAVELSVSEGQSAMTSSLCMNERSYREPICFLQIQQNQHILLKELCLAGFTVKLKEWMGGFPSDDSGKSVPELSIGLTSVGLTFFPVDLSTKLEARPGA